MRIREAHLQDINSIIDIGYRSRQKIYADFVDAALLDKKCTEEFPKMYKDIIKGKSQIENHFFPVLEDNEGNIIGYGIAGYVAKDWRDKVPLHWIHEIFLEPLNTGKGHGTIIMKSMTEHLCLFGEGPMALSVSQSNNYALRFYQKLGGYIYNKNDDNKVYGMPVPAYVIAWKDKQELLCRI